MSSSVSTSSSEVLNFPGLPPIISQNNEASQQQALPRSFLFQLPIPGQENVVVRGEAVLVAPSTSRNQIDLTINPVASANRLEAEARRLPRILKSILQWVRHICEHLDSCAEKMAKIIGAPIKYLGLVLLVAGAIHIFLVLLTTPPAMIISSGLIALVTALVTRGAVPTLLAGGALFFFGKSLLRGEAPAFHNFLNGFPIISYFMTLIPPPPFPTPSPETQYQI